MHEAALARAAQPATAIVLGTRLRTFSIGHELLLNSRELDLGRFEHLESAVLICCQSWKEYSEPDFWSGLKARIWKWRTWHWHLSIMRERVLEEAKKFIEYHEQGSLEFRLSDLVTPGSSTGARWPGAPFLLTLQQFIMEHARKSEEEAWDYPFGLAKMRWLAFCESEGGLNIYSDHDAEFDRFCAEEDAKEAAHG